MKPIKKREKDPATGVEYVRVLPGMTAEKAMEALQKLKAERENQKKVDAIAEEVNNT